MDRHSSETNGTGRSAEAPGHGRGIRAGGYWSKGSRDGTLQSVATFAGGLERSAAADWDLRVAGADRCGQNAFGQNVSRADVWRFEVADPARHERVHGEVHRFKACRFAAGIR